MIGRTRTGRRINRFCDQCGRWLTRAQKPSLWVKLTGHRGGNLKHDEKLCTVCFPPAAAQHLVQVIGSTIVAPGRRSR